MINYHKSLSMASGMRTGLGLLIAIGAIAALGSIMSPDFFYRFWWFKLLIMLLLVNMTLCAVRSLSGFVRQSKNNLANRTWYPAKLGTLFIHFGIIGILLGAAINAYYGQSAQIALVKGNQLNTSDIIASSTPFMLQLDDFRIDYYPNNTLAQYYSDVTVIENGDFRLKESISVNHPLQFNDIKFYQQDYGYLVRAKYADNAGQEIEDLVAEESILAIPGTKRVIKVLQYAPDFDPGQGLNQTSGIPDNPHIIFSVSENNKLLGIGAAKFNEKVDLDNNTTVYFTGVEPYTVLKVKTDPGLPLALAGGIMFVGGLALVLLSRPVSAKSKGFMTG